MVDFSLYLITDRKVVTGDPEFPTQSSRLLHGVEEALKAGVRAVQLREKDLPTRELLAVAYKMRELTTSYGARLFINDRLDIALSVDADGVHLGQSGIPVEAARKITPGEFLIGASTHNVAEALAASGEGADFVTFGPLYRTPSKLRYGEPVGLDALKEVTEKITIPVFGIGGVKIDTIGDVISSGARGIALISGILGDADIKKAAEMYLRRVN